MGERARKGGVSEGAAGDRKREKKRAKKRGVFYAVFARRGRIALSSSAFRLLRRARRFSSFPIAARARASGGFALAEGKI